MDLVLEDKRTEVFNKRKAQLETKSGNFQIKCYPTSIWEASSSQNADNINDEQRFEKISHIIKKFKLSCMSSNSSFKSMVIEVKDYSAYMDEFTEATYILVILTDRKTSIELIKLNVALCRQQFENKLNYDDKNNKE